MDAISAVTGSTLRAALASTGTRTGVRGSEEHGGLENVKATPENMDKVKTAVETLDMVLAKQPETRFHFQVHNESGTIQVQLVNFHTGEVMEEIPSKKLLDFTSQLEQLTGLALEKHA